MNAATYFALDSANNYIDPMYRGMRRVIVGLFAISVAVALYAIGHNGTAHPSKLFWMAFYGLMAAICLSLTRDILMAKHADEPRGFDVIKRDKESE